MREDLSIGPPEAGEVEALVALLAGALHNSPAAMREWMETVGIENFRLARLRGRVVAGLGVVRTGQWFGGASVPMAGLSAVGVAPEHRGTGVGSAMLRGILEELRGEGVPLSALYPATLPFYRRAGYERAGVRLTYELPLAAIDVRDHTPDLVPAGPADYPEFYRAYEVQARRAAGNLDRPAWMWHHKLEPQDQQPEPYRYLVVRDGQVEGYVIFRPGVRPDPLKVLDVCVLSAPAGRRLLTLFSGYGSMVENMIWSGGPLDPLIYLLKEPAVALKAHVKITRSFEWMLRILDVAKALGERGYPPGLDAELHFDLRDDLLPANSGRFTLQVAGGTGEVRPGGAGRIRLDARDLAAIYTGFMSPFELQAFGGIEGRAADLALAGSVFAGPRPWISDMF